MMKRRIFLQRVGSILAAMGVSQAEWFAWGSRYQQVLAQTNPRKLALLVGINQYPQNPALTGCLTDVELQRELLIHRFGFQPSDIFTLTEDQATREAIETSFTENILNVVKPGDAVVFHFSGYGTRLQLGASPDTEKNALVPANGNLASTDNKIVNYFLEDTLLALLRSLETDKAIAVLDTSYYAPSSLPSGGLGVRAFLQRVKAQLIESELEFQAELASKNLQKPELSSLVLRATSDADQLAREVLMSGFSAGLFTYALTQYLWETTPASTILFSLSNAASTMLALGSKQQPVLATGQKNALKISSSDNFLLQDTQSAEGVVTVTEDDGKTAQLWLAGIPPQVLESYAINSVFSLVKDNDTAAKLVLRSRNGLTGKAQITDTEAKAEAGQLIWETVRMLPRNIGLTVALDTALERIERVDATSAFSNIACVSSVVVGEQPADYVLSKLRSEKSADQSTVVSPSRYALFSLASEPIPNTGGEAGEAVKLAVKRLAPKLKTLLAAKLWQLTQNEGSSRLGVKASLEIVNAISPRVVIQKETVRGVKTASKKTANLETGRIPTITAGSRIQYKVQNTGTRPVYLMLVGLNGAKDAIALYPWQPSGENNIDKTKLPFQDIAIAPGETVTIPKTFPGAEWVMLEPTSFYETQLIFSTAPFTQTLATLDTTNSPKSEQHRIYPIANPLEVAQALLQDLHNASTATDTSLQSSDVYALDVNNWASFSFIYQVV